jgi:phosphoribosylanthranilate isomerase
MSRPVVKVCGNKYPENLGEVCAVSPDYLGFIMHSASPRWVSIRECELLVSQVPSSIKTVGVFVASQPDAIKKIQDAVSFSAIQLHGNQDVDFVTSVRKAISAELVKVFSVDASFDFSICADFEDIVDYFLFDTRGMLPGGNGVPFDWNQLYHYKGKTPFFLAGGISSMHAHALKKLSREIPRLYGFDINSGFETEPGRKDAVRVASFIKEVR